MEALAALGYKSQQVTRLLVTHKYISDRDVYLIMRKQQKQMLLEMAGTLNEAHEAIRDQMNKGNYEAVIELLRHCQECAISMGTSIETSEGLGFTTVSRLERYCEAVFEIADAIADNNNIPTGDKAAKKLLKALTTVINSINNDIVVKTEVVFLPYKASMWDSLESVWKAAAADENCNAVVIPIPYYDKNPDGSFKEPPHYEGDLLPEDVPIVQFGDYDFEKNRPDKIYIHNPYDEYNFVTSVHPYFYSSNLKNFTDELIYIPYFVLGEIDPENKDQLEGIKHFVKTMGVYNANKVIVQSEAMRQAYINILIEETGTDTREYWEQKIFGTGSPKIEKILSIKRENVEVPKAWEDIINKPDGEKKKIIFYNTSVQALLDNDMKMIDKIRDVLKIFKENSEDIALLWRPHPLIEATLTSMKPALYAAYKELINKYRSEGWGIYDDTPDMDRAVVISDAYYGDMSSIVWIYQKTGKPIMIQNTDILDED